MKKQLFTALITLGVITMTHAEQWNMATPYPDSEFHTQNVKAFIEEVRSATDGKIDITLHSGASLYKAPEIFKAVRSNQVQLGELLLSSLGNDDPIFKLDTLPFLATDYMQSKALWEASRAAISEKLEGKGVVLLYVTPWPGQSFYTKAPFEDIDYFKGTKLRAYNALTAQIATALGAAPTTVEVSDIAQAFSTGQIDGMLTSTSTGVSSQAWDYVQNFTEVNAWLPKNMIFINQREWRKLDEETQAKILAAAKTAETRGWQMSEEGNAKNLEIFTEHGMNVIQPSEAVMNEFAEIGEKMANEWLEETGDAGKAILDAYDSK